MVRQGKYNESIHIFSNSEHWSHSPRINGKLVLTSRPMARQTAWLFDYSPRTAGGAYYLTKKPETPVSFLGKRTGFAELDAESYAKFRGKLYKGKASLGVTFGSYKQSRDMIVSRYKQLSGRADLVLAEFIRRPPTRKRIAGFHLEVIFGWVPLLADIHAACNTVIQQRHPPEFIRSTARSTQTFSTLLYQDVLRQNVNVVSRVTRAAEVTVSNPNLWLAERAGLLNPAAVAWDLIPWSFVVNMFVNIGQLVNSITDFAGLTFPNSSITRFCVYNASEIAADLRQGIYHGSSRYKALSKVRELGATARPPLLLKMPEVNWYNASMAASLFTQKFTKILPLAQPTPRRGRVNRNIDWRNLSDVN